MSAEEVFWGVLWSVPVTNILGAWWISTGLWGLFALVTLAQLAILAWAFWALRHDD